MNDPTGDMVAAVTAAVSASTPDAAVSPASTTPAPATTAPMQTDQAAASLQEPEKGPIPYERFHEVNEQAKLTKKELETLAWAKGVKPEHAPELARFYQRVTSGDPLAAYLDEISGLVSSRPDLTGPLKSWAARTLGTRAASQEMVETDPEPQPDIQLEDGRGVYSAAKLAEREAWLLKQWETKIDAKLQPLQETANQTKADALYAKVKADAEQAGRKDVEAMAAKPHFAELKSDIRERMLADPELSLREAYNLSFLERVVPKLASQTAAHLQQKVGASSANPARPSGAPAKPSTDIREETARVLAAMTR